MIKVVNRIFIVVSWLWPALIECSRAERFVNWDCSLAKQIRIKFTTKMRVGMQMQVVKCAKKFNS